MSTVEEQSREKQLLRAGRLLLEYEWSYSRELARSLIWEAQEGTCACCDRLLLSPRRFPRSGDHATLDHVWPMGYGGPDRLGNLVLLTRKCNLRKGGRWPKLREVRTLAIVNFALGWATPQMPYIPDE